MDAVPTGQLWTVRELLYKPCLRTVFVNFLAPCPETAMCQPSVPDLIELLQAALKQLEHNQDGLSPDDPAFLALKRSIVRVLAELELMRLKKSDAA
jgi:hypothetical protein